MKKLLMASVLSLVFLAGCSTTPIPNPELVNNKTNDTETSDSIWTEIKVATDQKVLWEWYKIGWSHSGTALILPESHIFVDSAGKLLGGKITVSMKTIFENQDGSSGVTEHLKQSDFFDVANHPTSVINTVSVSGSVVTANLTIKGITKEISFPITITRDGEAYLLSAKLYLPIRDFNIGTSLLGKIALNDTFTIKLNKVAFIK